MKAKTGNFVLGVDGGNSKTDYYLFDLEGNYIDHLHAGTCSHEQFRDAYHSTRRVLEDHLQQLLSRHHLTVNDLAAGAFGLAGADIPSQKEQLRLIVEQLGFTRYAVDNDSFLGIKAGSQKGYGICSINGSGTCTGGISKSGERLQVGGVGSELSGDEAGGFYLARKVLRTVYDFHYRMGPTTSMTESIMELLQITDKSRLIEAVVEGVINRSLPNTQVMRILFSAADQGDPVALSILDQTGESLARSTAGCLHNLGFTPEEEADVILAGSVWIKAETPLLFDCFKRHLAALTPITCRFVFLHVPPAAGAVLWALELAHGQTGQTYWPQLHRKVIDAFRMIQSG